MNWFASVNLFNLFSFYLASMFVLGTYRRLAQYRAFAGIALAMQARWPKLFQLVREHRAIFLTWSTLLPSILTLVIWIVHTIASRLIWRHASLTGGDLLDHWVAWPIVVPLAGAMIALDGYFLIMVGKIDQHLVAGYFDQAEYWLRSGLAPVVRFVTLGYINPRQMVHEEVRKALINASGLINRSLYLTALQMGLRVAFGLALWMTWAYWPS